MKPRGEQWVIWTALAVVVVLIALALFGYLTGRWDEARSEPALPSPSKYDEHLIRLDKEALDAAYRIQLQHLFGVWMKDDTDQPRRMTVGLRQARRAYIEAMTRIEERERK